MKTIASIFALVSALVVASTVLAADISGQPLTRADCGKAGMRWNEGANVCTETTSAAAPTEPRPVSTSGTNTGSRIAINIDKTKQRMTVFIDGVKKYNWPVSTGRPEYSTPSGTYTATSMNEVWYSQEWDNAPMPHSIFFMTDGHAIHGSYEVKTLGKPVSHGCVRISPQNAATLYSLVGTNGLKNTQVVLTGVTPGGENKVASQAGPGRAPGRKPKVASWAGSGSRYAQAGPSWYGRGDQFQRPRGFFGRLFGGP
jgi:lipoprotein-anchoring transpeptidase ErfK/SrfK